MTLLLSHEQLPWLAGLVDGDGSIYAQAKKNVKNYYFGFQISVTFQVTQSLKFIKNLEYVKQLVGAGSIRIRGDVADFVLTEEQLVRNLLTQLSPFLRKKDQADLALEILEKKKLALQARDEAMFLEVCALIDKLSKLKQRSRGTNAVEEVTAFLKSDAFLAKKKQSP